MQYLQAGDFQNFIQNMPMWARIILLLVIVWSLIWKGLALWASARKGDKTWFVVFMVLNLLGIPEILYIYFFSKMDKKDSSQNSVENKTR